MGLSAEMLATMYAIVDLPMHQLAAGSGGEREREGVLNDATTLPNTIPLGRRDRKVRHVLGFRERREREEGVSNRDLERYEI